MKGLLLAGGHGTRLRPLTYAGNKHMLPIGNRPMLLFGLEHLRSAGITDVAIVLGPIKEGVTETIGDGSRYGMNVTYIDQNEPKGLAHAVQLAERFMSGEPFVMYLGDNLLKEGISAFIRAFSEEKADCVVGVCPVDNPSSFGIVEMRGGKIMRFVEKPKEPTSNLALIGVYVFNSTVFEAVNAITPSWRKELEITDAIQYLLDHGRKVHVRRVVGWWKDTGKPQDLIDANRLVLSDLEPRIEGSLSRNTKVSGRVVIESGSRTAGKVVIRGPVTIGKDCIIGPNVRLGPNTSIGDECLIKNAEIENTIVMRRARIQTKRRIHGSLIGNNATILDDRSVRNGLKLILGDSSFAQV